MKQVVSTPLARCPMPLHVAVWTQVRVCKIISKLKASETLNLQHLVSGRVNAVDMNSLYTFCLRVAPPKPSHYISRGIFSLQSGAEGLYVRSLCVADQAKEAKTSEAKAPWAATCCEGCRRCDRISLSLSRLLSYTPAEDPRAAVE